MTPVGNGKQAFFDNLIEGKSGIRPIAWDEPSGRFSHVAGSVAFDPQARFDKQECGNLDRAVQLAEIACAEAFADAGIEVNGKDRDRIGVYIGTGMGGACSLEEAYKQLLLRDPDRLKPLTVLTTMGNAAAAHIALKRGLAGPNLTFACACSSSAVAIGEGYRRIKAGDCDVMVAGGTEALLTYGVFKAWAALRVLANVDPDDSSMSCKPFARNRSGLVLAEGAGILILEALDRASKRNAHVYAEIIGYACTNDFSNIAKPSVEGQARALSYALQDAGVKPVDIDYINAHGTGTALNDVVETQAIKQVFGDSAPDIPISSTKSMHGHLMGAGGAVEFAAALLAIEHQAIPPTAHLRVRDPECDLDYVADGARRGARVRTVMSNSFAFGGTNAILVARQ